MKKSILILMPLILSACTSSTDVPSTQTRDPAPQSQVMSAGPQSESSPDIDPSAPVNVSTAPTTSYTEPVETKPSSRSAQ